MYKKIFVTVFLINVIFLSVFFGISNPNESLKAENLEKIIVDIKNSNALINTYSNLIKEIIPADEQQQKLFK
jgi:hypothetical protein